MLRKLFTDVVLQCDVGDLSDVHIRRMRRQQKPFLHGGRLHEALQWYVNLCFTSLQN